MSAAQAFLNRLQIASPCPASWAGMRGDDRSRFCATCEKHVYDFSKMTAAEGMALIREKEGQVCARLWRRADGTVITADCPVGVRLMKGRRRARLPLAATVFLAAGLSGLGCAHQAPKADPSIRETDRRDQPDPDNKGVSVWVGGAVATMDTTATSTGKTMSHEDWENLPLR